MCSLKTLSCLLAFAGAPAAANTAMPDRQLQFFASCAGRLSALMEHQWTHDTTQVAATTQQRAEMITLISAVMPPDAGRAVLLLRVDAKHAQAALLQRAVTAKDPTDAQWALQRAEALLRDCTSVLLPTF